MALQKVRERVEMSVKLMSKVFDFEFPHIVKYRAEIMPMKRDKETKKIIWKGDKPELRDMKTTGATCKIILLALSDHANDDGQGAYPSVKRLCRKTNLEKPTVMGGLLALRFHLFIEFVGTSIRDTNNYNVNPDRLEKAFETTENLLLTPVQNNPAKVKPLYRAGKAALPQQVKPLDQNHPLTVHEPNKYTPQKIDFMNMSVQEAMSMPSIQTYHHATNYFPGNLTWELVHNTVTEHSLTEEKIHAAAVEWRSRGFRLENIAGILDWAVNGIPTERKQQGGKSAKPNRRPSDEKPDQYDYDALRAQVAAADAKRTGAAQ